MRRLTKILTIALIAVMLLSLSSYIEFVEGVSQEDYDALQATYDSVVAESYALLNGGTPAITEDPNADKTETPLVKDEYFVCSVSDLMNQLN
jgi:hypothetical protein